MHYGKTLAKSSQLGALSFKEIAPKFYISQNRIRLEYKFEPLD